MKRGEAASHVSSMWRRDRCFPALSAVALAAVSSEVEGQEKSPVRV